MKKLLSTALAFIMMLTAVLPANLVSLADSNVLSGKISSNASYFYNKQLSELTIDGYGMIFPDETVEEALIEDGLDSEINKIKKIIIRDGITIVGRFFSNENFEDGNLIEITIPKSVKRISHSAFYGCSSLKVINYAGTEKDWKKIKIDKFNDFSKVQFNYSTNVPESKTGHSGKNNEIVTKKCGKNITCTLNYLTGKLDVKGKGILKIDVGSEYSGIDTLFAVNPGDYEYEYSPRTYINDVVINNGITGLKSYNFLNLINLKSVSIPKSVVSISENCFGVRYENDSSNAITDVYYSGTIVDWNNIKIGKFNERLTKAKIHYSKKVSAKELKYSLSKTSYVYDGKTHTPSVTVKDKYGRKLRKNTDYTVTIDKGRKSAGKYKVFIKFKGEYYGQKTMYFTIKPKPTSISKLTAGKKKFTVKWKKKTSQTTGYQIQYSTSSKFKNTKTVTVSKNKTTSKTISKLKVRKKYYVRVRTYKTVKVNGKSTKIYSAWSKAKTVITK